MPSNNESQENRVTPVDLRKRAGLTQRQVARFLDIRETAVSEWERKLSIPRLQPSKIKKMMEIYGCTIDELIEAFEGKEEEN